jgi:RHS repeat-associated protein
VRANPTAGSVADPALRALVAAGDALVRRFAYDPLYRLVSATGRACTDARLSAPGRDEPPCGFGIPNQHNAADLTAVYREDYTYDHAGNLTRLRHQQAGAAFVRRFRTAPDTNRLRTVTQGDTEFDYQFDPNGNLTGETSSRHYHWDHDDRLVAFRVQAGTAEPSIFAHYLYDAEGQRLKKLVRRQGGGVAATTYIDGIFEHHVWTGPGGPTGENNHLHVVDEDDRVAIVRVGAPHPDDGGPAVQYHLADHLGTSSVVVGGDGEFVNREEHTPYGETTFGGFGRKRYRFMGKERDEESGAHDHGRRYFSPWLARWLNADPARTDAVPATPPGPGSNPFTAFAANPITLLDPDGGEPKKPDAARTGILARLRKWRRTYQILNLVKGEVIYDPGEEPDRIRPAEVQGETSDDRYKRRGGSHSPGPPPDPDTTPRRQPHTRPPRRMRSGGGCRPASEASARPNARSSPNSGDVWGRPCSSRCHCSATC